MEVDSGMSATPLAVLLSTKSRLVMEIHEPDPVSRGQRNWRFLQILLVAWLIPPLVAAQVGDAPSWLITGLSVCLTVLAFKFFLREGPPAADPLSEYLRASFDDGQIAVLAQHMRELTDPVVSPISDRLLKLDSSRRRQLTLARSKRVDGQADDYGFVAALCVAFPAAWQATCQRIYSQHLQQAESAIAAAASPP